MSKYGASQGNFFPADPTVTDDATTGFTRGFLWFNSITNTVWVCKGAHPNAAAWVQIGTGSTVIGTDPGSAVDPALGGEIATPGGSDPWAALDGRAAAPTGSAQYPNYFAGYTVRPPWKVAGVDYRVGINSGVTLKNPATISSSIASISGNTITVQQNNVVLDGYDFSGKLINGAVSNLTIRNSKFTNLCIDLSAAPFLCEYCEFDGLGASGETDFGTLIFGRASATDSTFKYCWFHSSQADMIQLTTANLLAKYNLFDTMGYSAGGHADAIQFAGSGTANAIKVMFNTYIQNTVTPAGPSSFVDIETQLDAGATMTNPEVAYNVAKNLAGSAQGSTFYRCVQDTGSITGANFHDNYADPTNMLGVIYDVVNPGTGYTKSGNKLLTTGASF